MPFALLSIGVVMTIAAVRGRESDLFDLVKGDFTGPNNFVYWFLAILIIGSLGYVDKLKPLSNMFLALVLVGLLLHKQGFFNQFQAAIADTTKANTTAGQAGSALAQTSDSIFRVVSPLETLASLSGVIAV